MFPSYKLVLYTYILPASESTVEAFVSFEMRKCWQDTDFNDNYLFINRTRISRHAFDSLQSNVGLFCLKQAISLEPHYGIPYSRDKNLDLCFTELVLLSCVLSDALCLMFCVKRILEWSQNII